MHAPAGMSCSKLQRTMAQTQTEGRSQSIISHAVTLIVEGRVPLAKYKSHNLLATSKALAGYDEGPHCPKFQMGVPQLQESKHVCVHQNRLCLGYHQMQKSLQEFLSQRDLVIEVYVRFASNCPKSSYVEIAVPPQDTDILLERWTYKFFDSRSAKCSNQQGLFFNALRSSIHFSQLSSWLVKQKGYLPFEIAYRMCSSADIQVPLQSQTLTESRIFPMVQLDDNTFFEISCASLGRMSELPSADGHYIFTTKQHESKSSGQPTQTSPKMSESLDEMKQSTGVSAKASSSTSKISQMKFDSRNQGHIQNVPGQIDEDKKSKRLGINDLRQIELEPTADNHIIVDDRMHLSCEISGKHHCHGETEEDVEVRDERPKRRRSLSRPSSDAQDGSKSEYVLHGKFREVYHEEYQEEPVDCPNPFMAAILRANSEPEMTKGTANVAVNTDLSFAKFPPSAVLVLMNSESVDDSKHSIQVQNRLPRRLRFDGSESEKMNVSVQKKFNYISDDLKSLNYKRKKGAIPISGVSHISPQKRLPIPLDRTEKLSSNNLDQSLSQLALAPTDTNNADQNKEKETERPLVPSAKEQQTFRRSLESATHLIFHRNQGLPLLSSSAPRGCNPSFSYDSSLNSVSAIKIALVGPTEEEPEPAIPISPGAAAPSAGFLKSPMLSPLPMLGCFEESVLHGRIEPVSTVHGFTADVAASGSFIPPHLHLPVTVFFYSLCENDKVTTPYLSHINLMEKGYNIPRTGTIQVTLFNPLKTVVKMFIVPYDLQDMPPNSCTFLRQRTRYEPSNKKEETGAGSDRGCYRFSRYLIHLRFSSSKSGKIYLHTDIRMIISRKTDADTALEMRNIGFDFESYELRSCTYGPTNPKYSLKH